MKTLKNRLRIALVAVMFFSFTIAAHAGGNTVKINNKLLSNYGLTVVDTAKVYDKADKMPMPVGGKDAFYSYLAKKVVYPAADRENNVSGKVLVSVIVERDGKLTNVTAVKGPSKTINNEAVRIVKTAPKWKPATIKGQNVRVKYVIPINFALSDS